MALFRGAKVREDAEFRAAAFSGSTWFDKAEFSKYVRFDSATFSEDARFDSVTFSGDVQFAQARFEGYTSFERADFRQTARFTAVHAERAFTLVRASFEQVPGFVQAHFAEAPRLDSLIIPEIRGLWNCRPRRGNRDESTAAMYRALKRLAIQAHDHTRELDFFASELKASRGFTLSAARFLYELFSDFGRSMVRPLVWWGLSAAIFAFGYLTAHFAQAAEAGRGYAMSSGAWLWSWIVSTFGNTPAPRLVCLVGQDTSPLRAASGLSSRKVAFRRCVASSNKLDQIYACLYGIHGESPTSGDLPERFTPVIPDAVDYIGIGQLLLSLVLIFLFLLAVRNQFRIR